MRLSFLTVVFAIAFVQAGCAAVNSTAGTAPPNSPNEPSAL